MPPDYREYKIYLSTNLQGLVSSPPIGLPKGCSRPSLESNNVIRVELYGNDNTDPCHGNNLHNNFTLDGSPMEGLRDVYFDNNCDDGQCPERDTIICSITLSPKANLTGRLCFIVSIPPSISKTLCLNYGWLLIICVQYNVDTECLDLKKVLYTVDSL